jgi:uncharacterized membrane protein YgcG
VTVEADPQTTQDLATVRGMLDAALERSVFGKAAARQPDRVVRALRYVRTFKIGRMRLGHLCDVGDSGTETNPLSFLSKMETQAATALLTRALQRMQAAWIFANAPLSGSVVQAMTALQETLLEAINRGTDWDDISTFYRKWCRRVDAKASGFAGQTGAAQEAPDPRWAKDPIFDWVADLKVAVNLAGSKLAGKAAAEETIEAVIDARVAAAVAKQLKEHVAKRERSSSGGSGSSGGGGGGGGGNAVVVKTEPSRPVALVGAARRSRSSRRSSLPKWASDDDGAHPRR